MKNRLLLSFLAFLGGTVTVFAQNSYYPVYNTPPANPAPAANTAPAPAAVYYDPYYAPTYYGPIAPARAPGPFDPALGPWKWNFDFGGGPTAISGAHEGLTGGSNFSIGGGYNFTPQTGLVLEFMQSDLGISDTKLAQNGANDGSAAVWAVTINPVWRYKIGGIVGGYIIGGGGYYEREEKFEQGAGYYPYYYGFRQPGYVTRNYDDAAGLNLGLGFTFNVGWGTKLFVEARYHYIFTPGTGTQVIPVTFGFRW